MRIVIIGQRNFGQAVLEAFQSRGDEIAGVFIAPEKKDSRPDALRLYAQKENIKLFQFDNLRSKDALSAMENLKADIAIMAYVLQFVPQQFTVIPKLGTIQFHPSLLPRFRGPSAINWTIVTGEKETGVTVFRPTDNIDEGPIVLQKKVLIGSDETVGSLYYDHLFPLGIETLLEAADNIASGLYKEIPQDNEIGSYEGWFRSAEGKINWNNHVNLVYNLIRGSNPKPGAWITFKGSKVIILDAKKRLHRMFVDVYGKIGTITSIDENSISVMAHGGEIQIFVVQPEFGKKIPVLDFVKQTGLEKGAIFGD